MIRIVWHESQPNLLVWHFESGWTWQDFHNAMSTGEMLVEQSSEMVDCLLLPSADQHIPQFAVSHLKQAIERRPARLGLIVLVAGKPFVVALLRFTLHLFPNFTGLMQFVSTEEQALELIRLEQQQRRLQQN